MAQQGMFGNYQQQLADETALRRQQAQTGGLTGWAAITNAMSGIGSQIGYAGGQAMGGMTPVQAQQANYESIINSVPNFDPTSPESLNEMASAMWNGGEYDRGMEFYTRSQAMTADNLNVELKKLQIENAKAPKDKEMVELADGRMYYKDTLELVKPDLVVPEETPKEKTAAMLKYERNQEASKYRNTVLKDLPSNTLEEKRVLLTALDDAGYRDTAIFTGLQSTVTSVANTERLASKDVQTDIEQEERIEREMKIKAMGEVMDRGEGPNIVGGVFLRDKPDTGSATKTIALQKQIGGVVQSYDGILSKRGLDSKVTPAEAYPYYDKVFNLPEVYQGNSGIDFKFKPYEFNASELNLALDTIFGVGDLFVPPEKIESYINNGLLIPGVTRVFNASSGEVEIYNPQ